MQKKNGISLIVLVITIIVMIILAAAIIISLNNTGIISNANTAKTKTDDKQIREAIEVAKLNLNFEGGINERNLQNELQKSLDVDVEVINNMDKSYTIKVKDMYYTLEEDETVVSGIYDKWDKTSTEPTQETTNEIHIYKASEFKWLEEQVNGGEVFEGYTIYLENNLDLGARESAGTTLDEKWKTDTNKEYKWTPIGKEKGKGLKADFDGKNHIIKGIYIEENSNGTGLFMVCSNIKNLSIKNGYIEGTIYIGGITDVMYEGCIMSNCHNINVTIVSKGASGWSIAGGLLGNVNFQNQQIINCTNGGKIIGNEVGLGGIIGSSSYAFVAKDCYNKGTVESQSYVVGGIIGNCIASSSIENCHNLGKISAKGINSYGARLGGIIGSANSPVTVTNCSNIGNITGVGNQISQIGGIVGTFAHDGNQINTSKLTNCINFGKIDGDDRTGGIVGFVGGTKGTATIQNCYNKGIVTGNTLVGSIIGVCESTTNTIGNLYYLNTLNLKAINNTDYEDKNIKSTTKNINSFEEFKTWISQFK